MPKLGLTSVRVKKIKAKNIEAQSEFFLRNQLLAENFPDASLMKDLSVKC